jgi:hypothetical protein
MWGDETQPDIDVLAISESLDKDTYSVVLCEGCGMAAIGKDENDAIFIAMPTGSEDGVMKEVNWLTLEEYKNIPNKI